MAEEQIKTLVGLGLPEEQVRLHFVIPFFFFCTIGKKNVSLFVRSHPICVFFPPSPPASGLT